MGRRLPSSLRRGVLADAHPCRRRPASIRRMAPDLDALAAAFRELQRLPFPGHPHDSGLADWILELVELDGHLAGLATTVLGSGRRGTARSDHVLQHAEYLREIRVVGDDERIYGECTTYVDALARVERALNGSQQADGFAGPGR